MTLNPDELLQKLIREGMGAVSIEDLRAITEANTTQMQAILEQMSPLQEQYQRLNFLKAQLHWRADGTLIGSLSQGVGLEQLTCPDETHGETFIEAGEIPDSTMGARSIYLNQNRHLKIYRCPECPPLNSSLFYSPIQNKSTAYECPKCDGFVKGLPLREKYNNMGGLSGTQGTRFNCKLCKTELGKKTSAWS